MADFLYLAGATYATYNLVSGSAVTVSSENSLYPKENLYSADSGESFRFDAAAADDLITIDLGSAQSVDLCSIHGHNIDSGVTAVRLYSKASAFSGSSTDGTLEATFTKRDPAFFARLSSPVSRRYWRFVMIGTNGSPAEIGELVLGLASTATKRAHAAQWAPERRQIRNKTAGGSTKVFNLTTFATRPVTLEFRGTRAEMDDLINNIFDASGQGAIPVVLIPIDTATDVILATISSSLPYSVELPEWYTWQLVAEEMGFFVSVS